MSIRAVVPVKGKQVPQEAGGNPFILAIISNVVAEKGVDKSLVHRLRGHVMVTQGAVMAPGTTIMVL